MKKILGHFTVMLCISTYVVVASAVNLIPMRGTTQNGEECVITIVTKLVPVAGEEHLGQIPTAKVSGEGIPSSLKESRRLFLLKKPKFYMFSHNVEEDGDSKVVETEKVDSAKIHIKMEKVRASGFSFWNMTSYTIIEDGNEDIICSNLQEALDLRD